MAVVFSGAGGSGSSQTTRPADPGRPTWHTDYGSADAIVCLKTYLIKIWAPAHDVPLHADELAAFSMSSLTTSFMEYTAEHGVEELLRDGLNLTQGWMQAQLFTKQEWTCVVNLHAPDLAEHGGIARLFTMEPDDILHVAQTAVDAYGQCSCNLLFSEGHGHHIVLESFDPADRTFVYWDPWPGLTLLSRYADDSEVWHAAELVRHWKVTWSALSRLLYGIMMPTWCWDELHGRRSARPAPPAGPALPTRPVTSIDDLTDSQIRELLDFVGLCDQSGCLSDRVLLAFGLAAADGLLFAAADGGTTILQLLVGMVEAGSARGWNLEPDVLRTLILSTEPSIAHQNAYPPAKTITDSDVLGYVLRLLGTWSDHAGDTSGARRWLTRAAAQSPRPRNGAARVRAGPESLTRRWVPKTRPPKLANNTWAQNLRSNGTTTSARNHSVAARPSAACRRQASGVRRQASGVRRQE